MCKNKQSTCRSTGVSTMMYIANMRIRIVTKINTNLHSTLAAGLDKLNKNLHYINYQLLSLSIPYYLTVFY